jgi:hypothetical protein
MPDWAGVLPPPLPRLPSRPNGGTDWCYDCQAYCVDPEAHEHLLSVQHVRNRYMRKEFE